MQKTSLDPNHLTLDGLSVYFGSDKGSIKHNYIKHYEKIISKLLQGRSRQDAQLTIGEIGILKGASIKMWHHYMPKSIIYCWDIDPSSVAAVKNVPNCISSIKDLTSATPEKELKFDLFIDDGSHITSDIVDAFKNCWPSIIPGGAYLIEDLQASYSEQFKSDHINLISKRRSHSRSDILELINALMIECDKCKSVSHLEYYKNTLIVWKNIL